jgi:hypothetical protein
MTVCVDVSDCCGIEKKEGREGLVEVVGEEREQDGRRRGSNHFHSCSLASAVRILHSLRTYAGVLSRGKLTDKVGIVSSSREERDLRAQRLDGSRQRLKVRQYTDREEDVADPRDVKERDLPSCRSPHLQHPCLTLPRAHHRLRLPLHGPTTAIVRSKALSQPPAGAYTPVTLVAEHVDIVSARDGKLRADLRGKGA